MVDGTFMRSTQLQAQYEGFWHKHHKARVHDSAENAIHLVIMNWYLQRALQALFTIYLVITGTFVITQLLPGGPTDYLRAQLQTQGSETYDEEQLDAIVEAYINVNPSKPIWEQYIDYMVAILQGDFGQSMWHSQPVTQLAMERLPWTVFLMANAITLTFAIGITMGALMAYSEGTRFDVSLSSVATFLTSVPYYIFAVLFVYVLAYQLSWFPTGGRMSPNTTPGLNLSFLAGIYYHAALPVASLVLTGAGGWALNMRGNSVRVMGEDFIRVAELRGLSRSKIAIRYVGRNAILPLYTNLLLAIGAMFGGAVILEEIFTYPGLGRLLFRSIGARDYPLMMGCFILITFAVIGALFIADITYGKIDPRVKSGERHESF